MTLHVLMQESGILECEDFSYTEGLDRCCFFDHSEGISITVSNQEFIKLIAEGLAEEAGEEVDCYYQSLAVNIFAHSCKTGRANFLYNMLP